MATLDVPEILIALGIVGSVMTASRDRRVRGRIEGTAHVQNPHAHHR